MKKEKRKIKTHMLGNRMRGNKQFAAGTIIIIIIIRGDKPIAASNRRGTKAVGVSQGEKGGTIQLTSLALSEYRKSQKSHVHSYPPSKFKDQ